MSEKNILGRISISRNKPLGYLGGGIMTRGENLARQEEYDKFISAGLDVEVYSPIQNKSINDKSAMTEEQNNCLAEKITDADIERLWNSDFTVMCPEQSAIGTMCETGCLYGWKYMANKLLQILEGFAGDEGATSRDILLALIKEIGRIAEKQNFFHYSDIRTNHLNEKDWRRSFSINQLLYGMILYTSKDGELHDNFDEVLVKLNELYGKKEE